MNKNEINDILNVLADGNDEINDFTGMTEEERMYDDDNSLRPIPDPSQLKAFTFNPSLSPPPVSNNESDEYVESYEASTVLNKLFNTNPYATPYNTQQQCMPYNPYTYNDYFRR